MNIVSEVQRFNSDKRLNKLNFLYERNSFLDSLSTSRREESMIHVDFYNKHEKLITTMMEVIRRTNKLRAIV